MRNKKVFSLVLTLAVCATTIGAPATSKAASKPTLVKKLSLKAGQTKKITVKKAAKNAKLTWKTTKKAVAKIKKSGKFACKVTGVKKGTAIITCIVKQGKKKVTLKCKVTVSAKAETSAASATPSVNPSESPSAAPTSSAAASESPSATPASSAVASATPVVTAIPYITMAPPQKPTEVLPANIKNNYRGIFEHMGTCANFYGYGAKKDQLRNDDTIQFITDQFNSITLENEMKPDSILGSWNVTLISVDDAKKLGYVIPESYKEDTVPQLNFDATDGTLEFCAKYNMPLRGHTFMWHQQTPTWFFKEAYGNGGTVSPEVMNARLEFYIRTVMKHVFEKEKELTESYGSIVYAWDVVNEYLHHDHDANKPSWVDVYGEQGIESTYVKRAFEIAYDMLKEYSVTDKVTLFYNDYDTYFEVDDVVALVNYINKDEETNICGGIGMQSHIDIDRPTLDEYKYAMETFMNTGLEVQITELDVTINLDTLGSNGEEPTFNYDKDKNQTFEDQAAFVKDFMEMVISLQRNRNLVTSPKGITGVTIWGLHDRCSWRDKCTPLLFSTDIDEPKPAYDAFINAAETYYK